MLGQLGAIQRYYDGSEGASPSVFASSEALTSSRGLVVLRNTFSATLPSSDRLISERPCDGHADKRFFFSRLGPVQRNQQSNIHCFILVSCHKFRLEVASITPIRQRVMV